MKSVLQRIFAVILALSLAPWSQGEICPMKLQSQQADACSSANAHAHHPARPASKAAEHDCCPHEQMQKAATHEQCPPLQVTACDATMTCCTIDAQPSSSPQTQGASDQPVLMAVLDASLSAPVRATRFISTLKISFESSVFRLKEDLRI
jgi:Tfp pilus assembly protein PilE